jgi:outer membrane murein-binding lipoprotein Lpp
MKLRSPRAGAWAALAVLGVVVAVATAQPIGRSIHPDAERRDQTSAATSAIQRGLEEPAEAQICRDQPECQEIQSLSSRVKSLQARVDQLDAQVVPILRRANVFCRSDNVSANGAGDTDDCGYYRCDPVVGLCRQKCNTVNDCAPPGLCDTSGHCVPPVPERGDSGN